MAKKGLGKGLDALLGDFDGAQPLAEGVMEVDIYSIDTNAEQPRKSFDEERLKELAASIERHGILQPIVVRRQGERYTIVMGERRYRAARLCGLTRVPVVVKTLEDAQAMEATLIENLQREDLNPIEEAAGIRNLMLQEDLTQEEAAERLGKSRPAIANALRLLHLPAGVQAMLREGKLQAGHARALAGVKDPARQEQLAARALRDGLSVREVEAMAKDKPEPPAPKKKPAAPRDGDLTAAENALREKLGARVLLQGDGKKGRLVVEYYSPEALQDLYDRLMA